MNLIEKIKAGLVLKRAADQFEKEKSMGAKPEVSIIKGLKAVGAMALFTGLGAVAVAIVEPGVLEAIFASAGVDTAYAVAITLILRGAAAAYMNYRKHSTPPSAPRATGAQLVLLALLPGASAQADVFDYLNKHKAAGYGPLTVDGETRPVIELRFFDDFQLVPKWRAGVRFSLFTLARAGETAPPRVPASIDELSRTYSDGEVWVSVRREIRQGLAFECLSGLTFKMVSITGSVGDPLDGTKAAAACGLRLSRGEFYVSTLGGHYGPVADTRRVLGFVPNVLVHGNAPLSRVLKNTAFAPDIALGATVDPVTKRRKLTRSIRLLLVTSF